MYPVMLRGMNLVPGTIALERAHFISVYAIGLLASLFADSLRSVSFSSQHQHFSISSRENQVNPSVNFNLGGKRALFFEIAWTLAAHDFVNDLNIEFAFVVW